MSKMAELHYNIQEMYIEGLSARTIAQVLECDVQTVLQVLQEMSVEDNIEETVDL